ncbi:hypothetical protein ACHAWF_004954 [Thalassiosira exigua]
METEGGDDGRSAPPQSASAIHANDNVIDSRQRRRLAYRSLHRLLSVDRDSRDLKRRTFAAVERDGTLSDSIGDEWPWIPNRKCGSWYLPAPPRAEERDAAGREERSDEPSPAPPTPEVYFKSTDGHVGTYAVSLKRLNLPLLEALDRFGGCFLVDSSVRKLLPDSFSRTVPIWCAVVNRIVLRYRAELGLGESRGEDWDTDLHTPASIVSPEEYAEISNLIDSRVELLHRSKAVVDPRRLVEIMTRPVRAVWVANGAVQEDTIRHPSTDLGRFNLIVCCNPSFYFEGSSAKNHIHWVNCNSEGGADGTSVRGYYYTPGAADDDATWGRGLSSELFWENRDKILYPLMTEDETDATIDSIVNEWRSRQKGGIDQCKSSSNMDKIGAMDLWIGSRRAGRPPECWETFDAVLNVTENEYPNMRESAAEHKDRYYLQLPVEEGKRDKAELERWMPVGLVFVMKHLQRKRSVLVHCAQGRDRSVAVVLAFVALVCHATFPLQQRPEFDSLDLGSMAEFAEINNDDGDASERNDLYHQSGLARSLVSILLGNDGREVFLKWMHCQLKTPMKPFGDKESLRIVLHLVRQDRENAEPTRSTMQKINRLFMSSPLYRTIK